MRYIKPAFYDSFNCTADKCPDTCCAGWQIMIDENSLERYGKIQGDFGKRLRNSIDWQEGSFYQYNRRCAFLNEQNLCDLYTALGSDALCDTCRKYPRHVEEYEGLREWSLSLSCPVAAEIILSQLGFPEFIIEEDDEEDELADEFEDFDLLLFTQLEDARNAVFQRLCRDAESAMSVKAALGAEVMPDMQKVHPEDFVQRNMNRALVLAKNMQECLEEGSFFEIEDMIKEYQEVSEEQRAAIVKATDISVDDNMQQSEEELFQNKLKLYQIMYSLERLRPEWSDVLEEMYQILYADGAEAYHMIRKEFKKHLEEYPDENAFWENAGLQVFVFFVYTYFCGAVYDDWIYSKMALAVHSAEFIRELLMARWSRQRVLKKEDYIELSYRYAREIEHSDLNLNELEEVFAEEEKR